MASTEIQKPQDSVTFRFHRGSPLVMYLFILFVVLSVAYGFYREIQINGPRLLSPTNLFLFLILAATYTIFWQERHFLKEMEITGEGFRMFLAGCKQDVTASWGQVSAIRYMKLVSGFYWVWIRYEHPQKTSSFFQLHIYPGDDIQALLMELQKHVPVRTFLHVW